MKEQDVVQDIPILEKSSLVGADHLWQRHLEPAL
jgi:hypothetical protein